MFLIHATGIIVEYNPFHNGHKFHIEKAKNLCPENYIIAVMSGNFVQRGEPAMFDKYLRTKAALLNGVDMVLELPVFFATASAEYFAKAAISILDATGIVNYLCFGSETGQIERLQQIAEISHFQPEDFKLLLRNGLNAGWSFPAARKNAVSEILPESAYLLDTPNNILAIEYLKALLSINSAIKPFAVNRVGAGYHSENMEGTLSSATAIRNAVRQNNWDEAAKSIPENLYPLYEKEITENPSLHSFDIFSPMLHYIIKMSSLQQLSQILDIGEGLENRIIKLASDKRIISEMLDAVKSKRYTYTRLSRALLHILLGITKAEFADYNIHGGPQYIRVLGFRKKSQALFSKMQQTATLPVVTNLKHSKVVLNTTALEMLSKEIVTSDIYYIANNNKLKPKNYEYQIPLVII